MPTFTFKTIKPTGKYRSFDNDEHVIKFKKIQVGNFNVTDEGWRIRLKIIKNDTHTDSNKNCPWKWVTLKGKFGNLDEAKVFINNEGLLDRLKENKIELFLGN